MRRFAIAWMVLATGCAGLVDDTVPEAVRDAVHTMGDEDVRLDVERLALSPEIRRILSQLAQDLVAAAAGSARGPEVEASLRAIIATAIDEIRHETADLPPAMQSALDDLMVDAEGMVGRVVTRSLREVRAMVHGDDISAWVRGLIRDVLGDLITLASNDLDDASAERLGRWMRTAFSTLLADVELEQGTQRVARAAAHGFGDGLADSLHGELGRVLHEERDDLLRSFREESAAAAQPWEIATGAGALTVIVMLVLYLQMRHAHGTTIAELQRGAREGRNASEVLHATRRRGVKMGAHEDRHGPDKT